MAYSKQLGVAPVAVVASGNDLISVIGGLFKRPLDAERKAMVDRFADLAGSNPSQTQTPGTQAYKGYMRLKCLSGDSSLAVRQFYAQDTDGTLPAACGCATDACKEYAKTAIREVDRARVGLPPTQDPSPGTPGIGVTIPLPSDQVTIFGVPVMTALVGIGVVAYMAGKPRR